VRLVLTSGGVSITENLENAGNEVWAGLGGVHEYQGVRPVEVSASIDRENQRWDMRYPLSYSM